MIAYFWERDSAVAAAERLGGEVRRGRFHGEDDDEDHPWLVVLGDVDRAAVEALLSEHDGWLETDADTAPQAPPQAPPPAPPPLPDAPKRFKK